VRRKVSAPQTYNPNDNLDNLEIPNMPNDWPFPFPPPNLANIPFGVDAWLYVANDSGQWVPVVYLYPNGMEVVILPALLAKLREMYGNAKVTYVTQPTLPFRL